MLEARERLVFGRLRFVDATVTPEDPRDRARRRHLLDPAIEQPVPQLATAPGRMLVARVEHPLFDLGRRFGRTLMRLARAIAQRRGTAFTEATQPLVGRLGTDLEPATQAPH